jgi:hypothetical protein
MALPASPASQQVSVTSVPPSVPSGPKDENLTCQWTGCSEKFDTAEDLYVSQPILVLFLLVSRACLLVLGGGRCRWSRRGRVCDGRRRMGVMEQEGSAPTLLQIPSLWSSTELKLTKIISSLGTEPSLRYSRWSKIYEQPVLDLCVGNL